VIASTVTAARRADILSIAAFGANGFTDGGHVVPNTLDRRPADPDQDGALAPGPGAVPLA
jgi:hypothetical protein